MPPPSTPPTTSARHPSIMPSSSRRYPMKCLTLLSCVVPAVLALSPASGQTPPAPPLPRAETPQPAKTPRAEQPWPSDKRFERDFADRQRLLEERQRELMDQQVERQRALEE